MTTTQHLKCFTAVAFSLIAASGYAQQVPEGVIIFNPTKAQWAPTATPGGRANVEQAFIQGHVMKSGPYLYQVKFPPNFVAPAHTHPDDRTYTVLSGTWYVGFGGKFDESKLIALPPGSVYTEPKGVPHFVATRNERVQVLIGGTGPSRLIYVNPADAPAKK